MEGCWLKSSALRGMCWNNRAKSKWRPIAGTSNTILLVWNSLSCGSCSELCQMRRLIQEQTKETLYLKSKQHLKVEGKPTTWRTSQCCGRVANRVVCPSRSSCSKIFSRLVQGLWITLSKHLRPTDGPQRPNHIRVVRYHFSAWCLIPAVRIG